MEIEENLRKNYEILKKKKENKENPKNPWKNTMIFDKKHTFLVPALKIDGFETDFT